MFQEGTESAIFSVAKTSLQKSDNFLHTNLISQIMNFFIRLDDSWLTSILSLGLISENPSH